MTVQPADEPAAAEQTEAADCAVEQAKPNDQSINNDSKANSILFTSSFIAIIEKG